MKESTLKNLRIFWEIAISDFRLRYNSSLLGYLWTLIKPLMLFAILYVVFSHFMRFPVENYALQLLIGVIFWNFFAEATSIAMHSFINKSALITKVYFPRYLIILASTTTSLLTLFLNILVFFVFLFYSSVNFSWLWFLAPFFLICVYLTTLGVAFILSVFYVKFRDLQHIWEVLLQIGFWVTPVIYTLGIVPVEYHSYIMLNPIARGITGLRMVFIDNSLPAFSHFAIIGLSSLLILFIGVFIFNRSQSSLAEKI